MRANLGCGPQYLDGWVNVDTDLAVRADYHSDAFDFVRDHAGDITEVYMGHFLEHMVFGDALDLLMLLAERLTPGSGVSAVSPDMKAVFEAYLRGEIDNEFLNYHFVYSYEQPSRHMWCHDAESLRALFVQAGLTDVEELDVATWEPVYCKPRRVTCDGPVDPPQWRFQCGVRGTVPERSNLRYEQRTAASTVPDASELAAQVAISSNHPIQGSSTNEVLLADMRRLRAQLDAAIDKELLMRRRSARTLRDAVDLGEAHRRLQVDLDEARRLLRAVEASYTYQFANRISRVVRRLLPGGSTRRRVVGAAVRQMRSIASRRTADVSRRTVPKAPDDIRLPQPRVDYSSWLSRRTPSADELHRQRWLSEDVAQPLGVHVIVLPGEPAQTERTVASLEAQTWGHWKSHLLPGSNGEALANGVHRAGLTNVLLDTRVVNAICDGDIPNTDFIVFLRAGDLLAADCFFEIVNTAHRDPLLDLITWDDDIVDDAAGTSHSPLFRPSWSPDMLLSANYLGRSIAIRRQRLIVNGGFRPEAGDAWLWDLILRAGLTADRVARIPRILGHVVDRDDVVTEDGRRVVAEHLELLGVSAEATLRHDSIHIDWINEAPPTVTIIIPTRHNRKLLGALFEGLSRTDYTAFDVIVVDNGERTADNESWYTTWTDSLSLTVLWWDRPFNYSAVNNLGASNAGGDVLVFLNDDIEIIDPSWLRQLVGWAGLDGVAAVGAQLVGPEGRIQHGGIVLGVTGFAGHLFAGLEPGSTTYFGSTSWARNVLAVTGACLAIRKSLFSELGGFDERFELCGSDVALGIEGHLKGLRNVCIPTNGLRHLESATREAYIPAHDFNVSYWRYATWLHGGDPFHSPNLSKRSGLPELLDDEEPTSLQMVGPVLGRRFTVFRSHMDLEGAEVRARSCRASRAEVEEVAALHAANAEPFDVHRVSWFIPGLDSPFYGGINTALRIADHLSRHHGVENQFVVTDSGPEGFIRSGIGAAFPALEDSRIEVVDDDHPLDECSETDVAIATLWTTAFQVARFRRARRKAYLIQDFEPMFYPAGALYALAEASYRLGLYGICNTDHLLDIYRGKYGGSGMAFTPAVSGSVFHARDRVQRAAGSPTTLFVYSRPGHWRNCWELAFPALQELKVRLGERIRILAAGSWAVPPDGAHLACARHLGLLDYKVTGDLYRSCDMGLALTVSEHPSYLPLEFMACGTAVVAFDNPAGRWLLRDEENCLLSERTVDDLAGTMERMAVNAALRSRLAARALEDIAAHHANWADSLAGIYGYLCDPEGHGLRRGAYSAVTTSTSMG